MFLILTLMVPRDPDCATPYYKRVLYDEDSSYQVTLSQKGMNKFITKAVNLMTHVVQQMTPDDISIDIDLGAIRINFQIKDLNFKTLIVNKTAIDLNENNACNGAFNNCTVLLSFQWKFQTLSPPYISDSGEGNINIDGLDLEVNVGTGYNIDRCPGHLIIDVTRANIRMRTLQVNLKGGNSWIFNSLINILLAKLKEQLTDTISDLLIEAIKLMMDRSMNKEGYYLKYPQNPEIIKDDRFVAPWQVGNRYMYYLYSGYTYKFDNLEDEYINDSSMIRQSITPNYVNDDMVFTLTDTTFNNYFYIFYKYNHSLFNGDEFNATTQPMLTIQNTGVLVNFQITTKQYGAINISLYSKTYLKQQQIKDELVSSRNITFIYFNFNVYEYQADKKVDQLFLEKVAKFYSKMTENTGYLIINTPFVDVKEFQHIYNSQERVIRYTLEINI